MKDFEAISFDYGGTLLEPFFMPVFEVHKKSIQQVFSDDFSFSDKAIAEAIDLADDDVWKGIQDYDKHYFFSEEDWIERNRIALRNLGVTERLDERAKHMQDLWTGITAEFPQELKPDAKETLEQLRDRGYKLAMSTNWSDPSESLKSRGIDGIFQSIQFSIVPGYRKPSPYMLIQNAMELGVNPLNCVYVGNEIERDVAAAKRAGFHPVFVVNEGYDVPHTEEGVTVIHELKELLELFE
ncbi:MAG: HAD family hydrolase [Candidatus Thorarchaeota archaeon]|nr:MAG: HAD family hydrolase [Candidatus Thorarchaeota archaeon]